MKTKFLDRSILANAQETIALISNGLESSIIGKSLDGTIILRNEGARRWYGSEAEEVLGRVNTEVFHSAEALRSGKPREMMEEALQSGRGEGLVKRVRKHGETTPGLHAIPFILISLSEWRAHDQREALALSAAKFLVRPIEPRALLAEIEACLSRQEGE